ncbi:hypothetical protein F5883DRAFT_256742 [Diaporthe sp. PMI_573]|nr:hypothetical protein F5883DRAFT_256742 [Diaporthaceae sp. PMI_573]
MVQTLFFLLLFGGGGDLSIGHTRTLLVGIDLAPSTAAHLIGRLIGITSVALPLCDRPVHPVFLLLGTKVSQYNGQGWNMLARRYARAYFFGPIVLK